MISEKDFQIEFQDNKHVCGYEYVNKGDIVKGIESILNLYGVRISAMLATLRDGENWGFYAEEVSLKTHKVWTDEKNYLTDEEIHYSVTPYVKIWKGLDNWHPDADKDERYDSVEILTDAFDSGDTIAEAKVNHRKKSE